MYPNVVNIQVKGSSGMFKNLTPRQIALYASVLIALLITLVTSLMTLFLSTAFPPFLSILFSFILSFAICYFIILYFIQRYIYRKIKLIYKNIHNFKLSPQQKKNILDIDTDAIDVVEKEVADWTKQREEEIDTLKQMENYRREYLGNVSHELKTPIFNIQGFVHTLLEGGLYDNEINLKYLQRAAKNIERLNTIVMDLESINKLESGKLALDVQFFGLKDLVEEVIEDLEIKAKERNISLLYKEGADQNFKVKADRESIRQVLINLIENSIKYGNEGGHTKVSFYDMDTRILVEIADNGIGIKSEHLKHVFDRFYRADKSRARAIGGSGLGLSIVKHIMEAHKQTINVRSSQETGSTFGFTLEKA